MDKNLPNLLTGKEVAQMLKITPECVRKYVMQGKIPSVKIAGLRRFEKTAILKLIQSRREGPQV